MLRIALAALLLLPPFARASSVDLHAHLFMGWKDEVRLADLEMADVRILVANAYAPAVLSHLTGGYNRSILRQLGKIEKWAAKDPRVSIVRTPDEAQAVLDSKEWRLGVVLAVEGAGGADTPEKLEKLWAKGLRMITIAHFVDTRWGGAADVRYWPKSSCVPGGEPNKRRGELGLRPEGEKLLDWAISKGMMVDLAHASDKTVKDVVLKRPELPLLFSHTAARELTPCERTISAELLREVKRSGGLVGAVAVASYAGRTVADFGRHAAVLVREAGAEHVALGSDFNSPTPYVEGAGYETLIKELGAAGASRGAESFVSFWKRTLAASAARSRTRRP